MKGLSLSQMEITEYYIDDDWLEDFAKDSFVFAKDLCGLPTAVPGSWREMKICCVPRARTVRLWLGLRTHIDLDLGRDATLRDLADAVVELTCCNARKFWGSGSWCCITFNSLFWNRAMRAGPVVKASLVCKAEDNLSSLSVRLLDHLV